MDKPSAETVLQHNRRYIPGGISSVNRAIDPAITFVKARAPICGTPKASAISIIMPALRPISWGTISRP